MMNHWLPQKLALSAMCGLCIVLIMGCQKALTIESQPYDPKVSIEGLLQPGVVPKIYVNQTTPFFRSIETQTASTLFVPDANVTLLADGGVDELRPDSSFNRFFCRWEPYYVGSTPIRANTQYSLTVVHDGVSYQASTVTSVDRVVVDSVSYTPNFVDIFGGHEGVIVNFKDILGQANQYRFTSKRPLRKEHQTTDDYEYSSTCMTEEEEYLNEEIGRFVFFDENFDGADVRFVMEPFFTIYEGDEIFVYVQSLDAEVGKFYDALDRQHEANINPFAEPVLLYTQIPGAVGVFGAVSVSDSVRFVFPEDALN